MNHQIETHFHLHGNALANISVKARVALSAMCDLLIVDLSSIVQIASYLCKVMLISYHLVFHMHALLL